VDDAKSLAALMEAINELAEHLPVLFPVHPRTAGKLQGMHLHDRIVTLEPLGYLAFLGLMARARMVLTDSGGIQEETTVLHVPCLTLRENTERPITCEIGTNILAGTDPQHVLRLALQTLGSPQPCNEIPEKWDGHAADRIAEYLLDWLDQQREVRTATEAARSAAAP
jgi:UDP-N-acetylglucosamine 2-epimerase (non-hydrolysing)